MTRGVLTIRGILWWKILRGEGFDDHHTERAFQEIYLLKPLLVGEMC